MPGLLPGILLFCFSGSVSFYFLSPILCQSEVRCLINSEWRFTCSMVDGVLPWYGFAGACAFEHRVTLPVLCLVFAFTSNFVSLFSFPVLCLFSFPVLRLCFNTNRLLFPVLCLFVFSLFSLPVLRLVFVVTYCLVFIWRCFCFVTCGGREWVFVCLLLLFLMLPPRIWKEM